MSELNRFKTVTKTLTGSYQEIYPAPPNFAAIILMAQISNTTDETRTVTFSHYNPTGTITTELLSGFSIPPNDAVSATTGKLVLEAGQSVKAYAIGGGVKVVLSILETSSV